MQWRHSFIKLTVSPWTLHSFHSPGKLKWKEGWCVRVPVFREPLSLAWAGGGQMIRCWMLNWSNLLQHGSCLSVSVSHTRAPARPQQRTPPLKGRTFQLPCAEDLSSAGSNRARISLDIGNWKIFWWRIADFSHFLEIFLKKIWKKISKKNFFFTKICFSELEKAYVQLFVLNFFLYRS